MLESGNSPPRPNAAENGPWQRTREDLPTVQQSTLDPLLRTQASVRARLGDRERALSPFAATSAGSRGRARPEEPDPIRTEFQRDRDRIIHSKAFRRLKHKTQVFIAPTGDHYVTRLTHTLEVAQIARTIARALNLNEDLTEAIALGHDMGHTPFGHAGEEEMDEICPDGFRHAEQSLRIVDRLEKDGAGLNLTWEVRQGIVSHSKPQGDFLDPALTKDLTLEGQICRVSDAIAYLNHDVADAFRAGMLRPERLPAEVIRTLGERHSERISTMVTDIVASSWSATGEGAAVNGSRPSITMSRGVRDALNAMRDFMFQQVYLAEDRAAEEAAARNIIRVLYAHYGEHPDEVPPELAGNDRSVVDYVAGMTDWYAIRAAEKIAPGVSDALGGRLGSVA